MVGIISCVLVISLFVAHFSSLSVAIADILVSPWMQCLWAIAAFFLLVTILKQRARKRISRAVMWIHLSFIVLLAGAFFTSILGRHGYVELNEGERSMLMEDKAGSEELPFYLVLDDLSMSQTSTGQDNLLAQIAIVTDETLLDMEDDSDVSLKDIVSGIQGRSQKEVLPEMTVGDFIATSERIQASGVVSSKNAFSYGNWRISLASFDDDLSSCTLYLAHNPVGRIVTIIGFVMILISFVWYFIWRFVTKKKNEVSDLHHRHHHHGQHGPHQASSPAKSSTTVVPMLLLVVLSFLPNVAQASTRIVPLVNVFPSLKMKVCLIIVACTWLLLTIVFANNLVVLFRSSQAQHIGRHLSNKFLRVTSALFVLALILNSYINSISTGSFWTWTELQIWLMFSLLFWAAPMHRRVMLPFQNVRFYHIYTLVAYLVLMLLFCLFVYPTLPLNGLF